MIQAEKQRNESALVKSGIERTSLTLYNNDNIEISDVMNEVSLIAKMATSMSTLAPYFGC